MLVDAGDVGWHKVMLVVTGNIGWHRVMLVDTGDIAGTIIVDINS